MWWASPFCVGSLGPAASGSGGCFLSAFLRVLDLNLLGPLSTLGGGDRGSCEADTPETTVQLAGQQSCRTRCLGGVLHEAERGAEGALGTSAFLSGAVSSAYGAGALLTGEIGSVYRCTIFTFDKGV